MSYHQYMSPGALHYQLLVGIKKHLFIAQSTSELKTTRLQSLSNIIEVLDYVLLHMNEAIPEEELTIYHKFFTKLIVRVTLAKVQIHQQPATFIDEIGFISTVLSLR